MKASRLLYSLQGFRICDLFLSLAEPPAWQAILKCGQHQKRDHALKMCHAVSQQMATIGEAYSPSEALLDIAIEHLTFGRAALYAAVLEESEIRIPQSEIEAAVAGLRRAGSQNYIPLGLLTRAWLRFLIGVRTGPESAQADLDEAWEIAERGPMRLHMADIHLYRARLFHAVKPYPWNKNPDGTARGPKDDLAAARKLIEQCGYGRRKEELEDAEAAAKNWD